MIRGPLKLSPREKETNAYVGIYEMTPTPFPWVYVLNKSWEAFLGQKKRRPLRTAAVPTNRGQGNELNHQTSLRRLLIRGTREEKCLSKNIFVLTGKVKEIED